MRQGRPTIDQSPSGFRITALETFRLQWSPDSRWLTYARPTATRNNAIFLYDTQDAKLHQATTGYLNDTQPDVRSRRQVSVLRLGPRVRSGLRQLRQHAGRIRIPRARRRAAAEGREVAARGAQRRREPALDTKKKDESKKPTKRRQEARDEADDRPRSQPTTRSRRQA